MTLREFQRDAIHRPVNFNGQILHVVHWRLTRGVLEVEAIVDEDFGIYRRWLTRETIPPYRTLAEVEKLPEVTPIIIELTSVAGLSYADVKA